jgi:8-oxo-dGTP pyrophosphatase MutT (NUDIX family)
MTVEPEAAEVKASGGVVWRRGERGVEVVVVHRPRYDDWSLPKGKLRLGESWEAAALREVEEETGLRCELGELVGTTRYGLKEVRYFSMTSEDEAYAQNEVDEVRWVPLGEVAALLTYERDADLLRRLT